MNTSEQTKPTHALTDPQNWVDLHGDRLYRYALLKMRDPNRAEDVVQETFLAALHSQKTFNGQSPEINWLLGILNHKIIDLFRKAHREQPTEEIEPQTYNDSTFFNNKGFWLKGPAVWKTDPSESVSQDEFWTVLQQCLTTLPGKSAQAFMLREIDQLTFKEICDTLDITNANYWVIMHRSRMQLRACLERNWFTLPAAGAN